jgi:hypothetical protein
MRGHMNEAAITPSELAALMEQIDREIVADIAALNAGAIAPRAPCPDIEAILAATNAKIASMQAEYASLTAAVAQIRHSLEQNHDWTFWDATYWLQVLGGLLS